MPMKALAKWSAASAEQGSGKADLLLRFFQSNPFDTWVALQGLFQNNQPGVHDYLCNRLHELGEEAIEKCLLQLVYLAISKPGHPLEQTIVNLCQKSFRVAIKTQWLLVALSQDHPKSKTLENFRDRAYKAALEGKWEVPIRNPKLDPLSPPPFSPILSPGSSLMYSQMPSVPDLQTAQQRLYELKSMEDPLPPVRYVVTQPPGRMVMSPPGLSLSGAQLSNNAADVSGLARRKSGALQIDLGCLLPGEQRPVVAVTGTSDIDPVTPPSGPPVNGFAPSESNRAAPQALTEKRGQGEEAACASIDGADGGSSSAVATEARLSPERDVGGSQLTASRPAVGHSAAIAVPSTSQSHNGVFAAATANAITAAATSLAERYQSIRRELGEGEGVTALLERSKQQGGGYVAAAEDLSDDESNKRPMSPLTRLRYDTFGATLDFVKALCYASSTLASYTQEERHRALRLSLEHINREIEAANRREVAIWFPMGRGGDRVLRLTAREAVVLNSRDKAPFMLLVEVLEGQQECGDGEPLMAEARGGGTAVCAPSTIAGGGGAVSCEDGLGPNAPAPVVQFGRRETYGIALTGIGAQHQQHFMLSSPSPAALAVKEAPAAALAAAAAGVAATGHHEAPDGCSQGGSTTSGRASLPSNSTTAGDTASTVADTPGGLSPSMSLSSQLRSRAGSPLHSGGPTSGSQSQQQPPSGPSAPHPHITSPTPVHAPSAAVAGILEERATAAARVAASAAGASSSGSAASDLAAGGLWSSTTGAFTPGPSSQQQLAAGAVFIPTRSASNNNIAAVAVAAAAAAAASNTPDADACRRLSRGSDGGAGGSQGPAMQTPLAPSLPVPVPAACLPPRPPPPLPTGCMSPINAAKEVPSQVASQAPSALMSASALLRRVLGDRAEDAAMSGAGAGAGGAIPSAAAANSGGKAGKESGFSVVRSLCFSNPDPANCPSGHTERHEAIAAAAAAAASASSAPHLIRLPQSASVTAHAHAGKAMGQRGLSVGGGGSGGGDASKPKALQQPLGGELNEAEMQELLACGCLSPPNVVKSDPGMAAKLAVLLASLRGEAPMVRVRIRVLPQAEQPPSAPELRPPSCGLDGERSSFADAVCAGHQLAVHPQQQQPPAPAAPSTGSAASQGSPPAPLSFLDRAIGHLTGGGGEGSGTGAASSAGTSDASSSFSLASLPLSSRVKAAMASLPTMASDDGASVAGVSGGSGVGSDSGLLDKSKVLLSKLGLCRKPTTEDDTDLSIGAGVAASGGAAAASAAGGATELAASERQRPWSSSSASRGSRLVQVTFEVAQGVNLTIPSPYRKSRRTPSHEAIEMLAGKYKVQVMPPPYQCGPPLGPLPDSPRGATYTVHERPSEEGEGAIASDVAAEASFSYGTNALRSASPSAVASTLALLPGNDSPACGLVEPIAETEGAARAAGPNCGAVSDSTFSLGRRMAGRASRAGTGATSGETAPAGQQAATVSPPTPTLHQRVSLERSAPASAAEGASSGQPSSGLAASLQSSLTRMLARASGQQSESGLAASKGSSPRGGSPVRGAAAGQQQCAMQGPPGPVLGASEKAGSGAASSRLSRLMGGGSSSVGGALPEVPAQAQASRGVVASAGGARPPQTHPVPGPKITNGRQERECEEERRRREAIAVYGELWAAKVKRIQRESPHGRRAGWALRCVIVKSGDDCRQELLALQLIRLCGEIFRDAGLPLWVRHYEVLVTSNKTALIEMVPNTLSIHTIKSRSPHGTSLSDHFFAKFGRAGTPECTAAQRRFTESMAAYSLICYVLQIKDRHNGNILLDDDGRVVHIDFGFLLSNSPGGVNFEAAPFKLTRELLEVMDSNSEGRPSEMFDYFKVLMIQGFLALRKHADRILLLVRMMAKSGFPCFKAGDRAVKALEKRLQLSLTEVQCVAHVLQLIAESLDAWRTRQYDYYQRVLNGIL